jgi:hypothetical protein
MDAPATTTATRDESNKIGLAALIAGACIIVGSIGSAAVDMVWVLMLAGFALMIYAIPGLHRHQAPADGAVGLWGSRLVAIGGTIVLLLGIVFLIWEAVGTPPEDDPAAIGAIWMIGFFGFAIGMVMFTIGALRAKVFPQGAPILMLVGIVGAIAIDMATGAFFEDMEGGTTEWGFYIGVPLFGLGLAWIGYTLWNARSAQIPEAPPA